MRLWQRETCYFLTVARTEKTSETQLILTLAEFTCDEHFINHHRNFNTSRRIRSRIRAGKIRKRKLTEKENEH